jgi:hypothetical protein
MFRRMLLVPLVAAAMTVTGMVLTISPANAGYGPGHEFQITLSMNCDNPSVCGSNLGGDWGWAVLNANGTGDLQSTFCFHVLGMGGGGAGHASVDIFSWTIADGHFVILSASDPSFVGPTPIPSAPGRYRFHPAPGVNTEVNVVAVPSH